MNEEKEKEEITESKKKTSVWNFIGFLILFFSSITIVIVFFVYYARLENLKNWKYVEIIVSLVVLQFIFTIRFLPINRKFKPLGFRRRIKVNSFPYNHRLIAKILLLEGIRGCREKESVNNVIVYFAFTFSYAIYSLQSFIEFDKQILFSNLIGFLPLFSLIVTSSISNNFLRTRILNKRKRLGQLESSLYVLRRHCLPKTTKELSKLPSLDILPYNDIRFFDFYNRIKYLRAKLIFDSFLLLDEKYISKVLISEFDQFLKKKDLILIDKKEIVNLTRLDKNVIEGLKEYFLGKQLFLKAAKNATRYQDFLKKTQKAISHFDNAYNKLQNSNDLKIKQWGNHFKIESNYLKLFLSLNYKRKKRFLRENISLLKRLNRSLWFNDYNSQLTMIFYNSLLLEVKASSNIIYRLSGSHILTKEQHKNDIINLLEREEYITKQMFKEKTDSKTQTTLVEEKGSLEQVDVSKTQSRFGDFLFMIIFAILSSALLFLFGEYYITLLIRDLAQWQIFLFIILPIAILLLVVFLINRHRTKRKKQQEK